MTTTDSLLAQNRPPEYANISVGVYHVVAFPDSTACGRKFKQEQIATIPTGRMCLRCAASRDWYTIGVLKGETP